MKGCGDNVAVPLTESGTRGLGLGGGPITVGGFSDSGLHLSIQGNPWTIATVSVDGFNAFCGGTRASTRKGFAHGPESNTSSTARASGVVQLVSPVVINTSIVGYQTLPLFGTLRVQFVPEPATLALLGAGVTGLALLGRRSAKR